MIPLYHEDIPTTSGIYRITCTINQKIYIGSAINLRKRFSQHLSDFHKKTHHNTILQRAWDKHGDGTFTFEIIEFTSIPLLIEREQYWIDTLKPTFNINPTAGSCYGRKFSPETLEKMRQSKLGKRPTPESIEKQRRNQTGRIVSEETRAKIGNANRGKPGKSPSKETRAKLSAASKGKTRRPEWGKNISQSKLGHPVSEESRERMRLAHLGTNRSPEAIEKGRQSMTGHTYDTEVYASRRKTFILTNPDGAEYVINDLRKFCKEHNLNYSCLIQVAKGNANHHKGWKARYPD